MKTLRTTAMTLILLLTGSLAMNAKDTLPTEKKIAINNISCNGTISGDGFEMQYVPSIGIRFGKRIVFSGAPIFSSSNWKNEGYALSSQYILMREEASYSGHMILSANVSYDHFSNIGLSAATVRNENRAFSSKDFENLPNFKDVRYAGYEVAAGFGISYRFRCGLLLNTEAGFSYYDTKQKASSQILTIKENQGMGICLSAGIGWKFGKMMSRQKHDELMKDQEQQEEKYADQN